MFPCLSTALPMAARGFPSDCIVLLCKSRQQMAANCDLAAPKCVSSMLLLALTMRPGSPGMQCEPCCAASGVCLHEQVVGWNSSPNSETTSSNFHPGKLQRGSEHRPDGSTGCSAPELSSLGLPAVPPGISRAKRQL